jgi:acetoin utilization deacetylase AcuC-like enzyme
MQNHHADVVLSAATNTAAFFADAGSVADAAIHSYLCCWPQFILLHVCPVCRPADDPSVFTFSIHCGQQSFPAVVQQSDWDIPLPAGTTDAEYLQVRSTVPHGHRVVQCPTRHITVMRQTGNCRHSSRPGP